MSRLMRSALTLIYMLGRETGVQVKVSLCGSEARGFWILPGSGAGG